MSGEFRIVRSALVWGATAAVPASGIAFVLRGPDGAASAAIASGIVLANAGAAALMSALAGRLSAAAAAMVSLPSFVLRMAAVAGVLVSLKGRPFIDDPTFALAFGLAVTGVLALEASSWKRTPWIALTLSKEKA